MKKMIAIILLCMLCVTACAKKPEEFTIRNGIKFGMSAEGVIAIEGKPYGMDNDDPYYYDMISDLKASIYYRLFEDKLWRVGFTIYPSVENSIAAAKEDYEKIEKELIKKLGKPDFEEIYPIDKYATTMGSQWIIPYKDRYVQVTHSVNYSTYNEEEQYRWQSVAYMLLEREIADELLRVLDEKNNQARANFKARKRFFYT